LSLTQVTFIYFAVLFWQLRKRAVTHIIQQVNLPFTDIRHDFRESEKNNKKKTDRSAFDAFIK